MKTLVIDFQESTERLFTGISKGFATRNAFNVCNNADLYILKNRKDQLITSSYFLGLLQEVLDQLDSMELALTRINTDQLDETSRNECERAIRRHYVSKNRKGD